MSGKTIGALRVGLDATEAMFHKLKCFLFCAGPLCDGRGFSEVFA